MKLAEAIRRWPDHESALAHLEDVRWHGSPLCPYCESEHVSRHASPDRSTPRWQCRDCQSAFSATAGTLFQNSRLPLNTWFVAIVILFGETKVKTAARMSRILNVPYKTAWSLKKRIIANQSNPQGKALIDRIINT